MHEAYNAPSGLPDDPIVESSATERAPVLTPSLLERYLVRDPHAIITLEDPDWHYTLEEQAQAAGFDYLVDEFRDIDEIWQRGLGREVGDLYQDHLIEEETKALLVPRLVDLLRHTAAALRDGDPLVRLKSRAIIDCLFADVVFRTYRYDAAVDAAFQTLHERIGEVGILPKLPVIYPEQDHPGILKEQAPEREETAALAHQAVIDESEPALIPTQYYEVTLEHGAVAYDRIEEISENEPEEELNTSRSTQESSDGEQAHWFSHDITLVPTEILENTWLTLGRPDRSSGSRSLSRRHPWHKEGL